MSPVQCSVSIVLVHNGDEQHFFAMYYYFLTFPFGDVKRAAPADKKRDIYQTVSIIS
jgi:hypothetical protein